MTTTFQQIQIIINPASGQDEQILNTLNKVFQKYDVDWQVAITQGPGDARRLAEKAVATGADLVAGYGGDGTLMEIASGLFGSDLPLGVLPGGTANNFARELEIPLDLPEAAELLCRSSKVREIDIGEINDRYFLLHAYTGVTPAQQTNRELKDNLGLMAYLLPIFRFLKDSHKAHYSMTIDGQNIEQEGIACILLNAFGWDIKLPLTKAINPNDNLLDVIFIKKDAPGAVNSLLEQNTKEEIFQQWQCREITVSCTPPQDIWTDGEAAGKTPFTAAIAPNPLRILVPGGNQQR